MSRLPRNRRVKNPPAMRLTSRDVDIIKLVHDCRVLRGTQIQAHSFKSQSTSSYRLSRLYQHGYLDRHFLPALGGLASSPTLYTVGKRGMALLFQTLGLSTENRIRRGSKDLSPLFLEHILRINDFRIAVTLATHQSGYSIKEWIDDSILRSNYEHVTIETSRGRRAKISLIPDSYFVLSVPQGNASFFLELDRGTMTLGRYQQKIQAYQSSIFSGKYQRRYKTRSLRVLTVTEGEKRLNNLKKKTEDVNGRKIFWFTTFSSITFETVLREPIWNVAGSDHNHTLIPTNS